MPAPRTSKNPQDWVMGVDLPPGALPKVNAFEAMQQIFCGHRSQMSTIAMVFIKDTVYVSPITKKIAAHRQEKNGNPFFQPNFIDRAS